MNAPVPMTAVTEPRIFDFTTCSDPVDAGGRATWARVLVLQAHVQITQLNAVIREFEAERLCDTCGARSCVNPSFCAACRVADEGRRQPTSSKPRRTPETTIEAIKQAVLGRGVAALDEPATEQRLRTCDAASLAELDLWLAQKGFSR
jgi:hypothetical protein